MFLLLNNVKASEVNFSHVMITAHCDEHRCYGSVQTTQVIY